MKKTTVNVVTLGCSKNLVDSEKVLRMLSEKGFQAEHQTETPTDIVIVNTCGFIGDAKEESVEEILRFAEAKNNGVIKELYVMGCLSERYRGDLIAEMPEVDRFYGKFDWVALADDLAAAHPSVSPADGGMRHREVTTGPAHAYLKIAEGCNRFCAFCAIPLITGRFRSRTVEDLVAEAEDLASQGITELNVIAQDLSSYGRDLPGGKSRLAELVERLAAIDGIHWIRLHYAYPADFPMDVLDVMAREPKVCKYLDIALQHSSDKVLANMRRHITEAETRALIAEMRHRVPGIHIRTTLMTGFPGEGEAEFENLMRFTSEMRFERMGAFAYCEEEGTFGAENFNDDIPQEVKQNRLDRLMALQEEISQEIQNSKIGSAVEVVVDREEDGYYICRTQWDSPEVDPEVLVRKTEPLVPGTYRMVVIEEALPFELIASVVPA
ncbi:MAG: 30S ribosomal protein S12 methylthiotransferase RimO [Muribaculaceae bacterium]|nr:30S ribosomal protein S12 methylthiotransferase RimO [Muribaculaceae bacterium]